MLNEMIQHALQGQLEPSDRDFYAALKKSRQVFIFECKRRSPSEGALCEDYPVKEMAKTYEPFADVISVLTNQRYFDGSFTHLKQVRDNVKVPVLCKDIIVSPQQIILARHYGADAVLLMLSVLDDDTYQACHKVADELNMGVLTEVVTEHELIRATHLKAKVIAVNHRDLHTFEIDKDRVINLSLHFPKDTLIIAASGISTHQEIARLAPYVNGFLIGSSLSKSKAVDMTLRELIYGPVKICGLTRGQDSLAAYQQGAMYGGLIFVPTSKRCITLTQAEAIIPYAPLRYVGVFSQQPIDMVLYYAAALGFYAVQLHGGESAEYVNALRQALPPNCQIWLAMNGQAPLPTLLPPGVDKLVIDNMQDNQGGTGITFDWGTVRHYGIRQHCLLAGGISPTNALNAKQTRLGGLDVNSGVEQAPGIKDVALLEQLFKNIRGKC